ncbi:TetR/AcrR family transcriptional regulator C-terminal domain-containing protein [Clostridium sp. OS1-26]|uniref:TetR/AcrR family transcriptional regulator C-terminal domain-containing protein n=1 Tax=Clostridium sp. OS1-26 TaxID=3070681 RepID=UPI0027E0FADF|nr:TetR/AcrR family transcriptional regulator C-terminal domain-containing protein [Clostridium sp. OS1-26]WML34309.1 TetR/AcrR family transcriptional regulator C-terminal domain-containing protein [Clostridium sp. OS1-26]
MAKIKREEVIEMALELLKEGGLEAITTRRLAQRLGVESASLYWHVKDKATLLGEMAFTIMTRYHTIETPQDTKQWEKWFIDNACSFRNALLAYPDGAMLHAGSIPIYNDLIKLAPKIEYLMRAGFSESEAQMAMLTMSQFTIGCVIEEQTRNKRGILKSASIQKFKESQGDTDIDALTSDVINIVENGVQDTFEFGLKLIIKGLKYKKQ